MAIQPTDLQFRLSGGAANANANASLGGALSSVAVPTALFDDVPSDEATSGKVEYRGYYVRNGHATLTAIGVKVWIPTNSSSPDTDIAMGLGTSAINGTEQAIANETTAPTGVTFTAAGSEGASLAIGDLAPGASKFVWERRTVNAGAAGPVIDTFTRRAKCDTLP